MKLKLERRFFCLDYTIGRLEVDGAYFCDTLEDRVRDLAHEKKVAGQTAIPAGKYGVVVNVSPRFGRKLPRLLSVPGFEGILIHRGNTAADTAGCILLGENKVRGKVINSTPYELKLIGLIDRAQAEGETVTIEIK